MLPNHITTALISGGTKSGKSSYALSLGKNAFNPYFIATGWATDSEMEERIQKHQKERGDKWHVIETRTEITKAIRQAESENADFILVDCLTLWTSNVMFEGKISLEEMLKDLVKTIQTITVPLVFVTNEVGCGIVPENKLAREFRDNAGYVNKTVAQCVDQLVLMVCGQPLTVK